MDAPEITPRVIRDLLGDAIEAAALLCFLWGLICLCAAATPDPIPAPVATHHVAGPVAYAEN